jgi:hypothetical protein
MMTLGQIAYEAGLLELLKHGHYEGESGEHVMPTWESIGESKRKAWGAAAKRVENCVIEGLAANDNFGLDAQGVAI